MTAFNIPFANSFMPIAGTKIAEEVDTFYAFLVIASVISFIILIGGMVWFLVKYKRTSSDQKSAYITHNNFAEFTWSFIPLVILMVIFYWGWDLFAKLRTPPQNIAEEIHVTAKQWSWEYKYKNGKEGFSSAKDPLVVPAGKPVKIILTSKDVIHSFFVPAFRIKQDAVPGKYTEVWFEAKEPGNYIVFCTEYCGTSHSDMMIQLEVKNSDDYIAWYHGDDSVGAKSLAEIGEGIYKGKGGCNACHSLDGVGAPTKVGPSFKGLFGMKREFADGSSLKADENYLRESILQSGAKIVKGYPSAMPVFQGQLDDEEVSALIEFIKSVE